MRKDLKCGIRGPAIIALGIAIFGMGQTASAGNYNSAPTATAASAAPFKTARIDPALYPHQIVGHPYQVAGKTYYPAHNPRFDQSGQVSWYGAKFHGKLTASGEAFDKNGLTAAHRTLPLHSLVKVTNLTTGAAIVVRINDRGPFTGTGVIDLSEGAAVALGYGSYQGNIRVQYAGPARPMRTAPKAAPQARPKSLLPQIELPQSRVKVPQAYQDNQASGDGTTVLTIKGPIHSA